SRQCGGKIELTVTRFAFSIPASRSASSNDDRRSRCFPTPFVKKMARGTIMWWYSPSGTFFFLPMLLPDQLLAAAAFLGFAAAAFFFGAAFFSGSLLASAGATPERFWADLNMS